MIFIGPPLLSGIGQHTKKYMDLFPGSIYYQINDDIPECDHGFIFALPLPHWINKIQEIKKKVKNIICMTVCETQPVHEDYGLLFKQFNRIACPSKFCKDVFSKQFPDTEFYIIHAHIPYTRPYVFYHIGNILDDRKNFRHILEAFIRLNKEDSRLVVKATCKQPVEIRVKNVEIINGLLPDEELDRIHAYGDCYVGFSSSEGVGMGAVEAAIRDKPVICTEYGGASEYIKTPYMINCKLRELEKDDFLYKKGMQWGDPDFNQLTEFMKDAYNKRIVYMDHSHTKHLTNKKNVLDEFVANVVSSINDNAC